MKVLMVNYEYPPQGGGAAAVMFQLARALTQRRDVELTILAGWDARYGNPGSIEGCEVIPIAVRRNNVHFSGMRSILEFIAKGAARIRDLVTERKFDLVHFHFSVPTGLLKFRLPANTPYLCSLHGLDVPMFVPDESPILQTLMKSLNRIVVSDANAVVAPSMSLKNAVKVWLPHIEPVVIHHGVDLEMFKAKQDYARRARRFVCVARLARFKRIELLIDAFHRARGAREDAVLDIYGDGYLRETLKARIAQLNASSYIRLCGPRSQQELAELLPTYDAFVLPSTSDSFGLVFVEAMAAGLPVIAANAGGPGEIVLANNTGMLVDPDNVESLVEMIERAMDSVVEMSALGQAGRKRAEEKFAWGVIAGQYCDVYDRITSEAVNIGRATKSAVQR
jgi:glycosyltransferase involved in cell wall biosynthesis